MSPVKVEQARMVHVQKIKGLRSLFACSSRVRKPNLSPEVQSLKGQDLRSNFLKPRGNDRN